MSSIETIWEMQDEINPHSYARVLDGVVNHIYFVLLPLSGFISVFKIFSIYNTQLSIRLKTC